MPRPTPSLMLQSPLAAALVFAATATLAAQAPLAPDTVGPSAATSALRDVVERYTLDRAALLRRFPLATSPERLTRLGRFYTDWETRVAAIPFASLDPEGRADHVLLRTRLAYERRLLAREQQWVADTTPLLPFAATITSLHEARLRMDSLLPQTAAATLEALATAVDTAGKAPLTASKIVAFRAQEQLEELARVLKDWQAFYTGYDPLFTWWADAPAKKALKALDTYRATLRTKGVGMSAGAEDPIVGTPIGRAALVADLGSELIPYTPEELLAIGERELAWCEAEMKQAARDMGLGEDWRAALERVKTLHVEPGRQPDLIRDLAREAETYLETHDLISVPPLAKEIWRMQMMSPERQRVNPFFTGGEVISVSFPTDGMAQDDKLMSLRGNNIHFARATVHHELIPGHHLQGFMTARYNRHRNAFQTPFWLEGWSLYWEMLLWDRGFATTPENRVGMLFWRAHRAARIIFSLRFHLGEWTPQQCIDFLVTRVGHERANAEAEVRRSFNGTYPPLYQLAYMMGGLQFRALHQELVGGGRMTNRQFHDAVITGGHMPVEMIRVRLRQEPLTADFTTRWRFDAGLKPGTTP